MKRRGRIRALPAALVLGLVVSILGSPGAIRARPSDEEAIRAVRPIAGDSLAGALERLRYAGLAIVFSEQLVRPEMRVLRAPTASEPREILREILAPHGLEIREGPHGRILVVPGRAEEAPAPKDDPAADLPVTRERIDVTASRPWVLGERPSALALDREDLLALPQVGDDIFRGLAMLPGTTSSDASARLIVRGGGGDDVLVRLDGVEIVAPYHLEDFNDALGILAPSILDRVELLTGGFPAEYGDRMSGVLEMTTLDPSWRRRTELGADILQVQGAASGTSTSGELAYLASVRGGSLEIPFRFAEIDERPTFGDVYANVDRRPNPRRDLRAGVLGAGDRLRFSELGADGEAIERFDTRYANLYGWLAGQSIFDDDLFTEARFSASRIDRDRQGFERDQSSGFDLRDDRTSITLALAADASWQRDARTLFEAGIEARWLESDYDYRNDRDLDDVLALVRDQGGTGTTAFARRFRGNHYVAYVSTRLEPSPRWVVEAGVRFDRNTVLDDDHATSPRLGLHFTPDPRQRVHASWGRYTQSQRLYELQVQDGLFEYAPTEIADFWSVGYERTFENAGSARRPLTLRVEIYERRIDNPRPRFENLFDPISKVPELESDRVRIAPESGFARGAEIFLGGAAGRRIDWFANYTRADTFDRIDGRDVPRAESQPHALRLDVTYHAPGGLDLHAAWHAHTGWPTTALDARLVDTLDGFEIEPVLGPLRAERLPDYRRLDVRVSRDWPLRRGRLRAYLEVQNVLDRRNLRGFDPSFEIGLEGEVDVRLEPLSWGHRLPMLGVRWTF